MKEADIMLKGWEFFLPRQAKKIFKCSQIKSTWKQKPDIDSSINGKKKKKKKDYQWMQTDFSHHCHLQHKRAEAVSSTVWGIMQRIQDEKH